MTNELHVVFGAGQVGGVLARRLASRGLGVRVVSRGGRVVPGVEAARADAFDAEAARVAARGAAVVYHTLNTTYDAGAWSRDLPRLQTNVAAAAVAAGARLVVLDNLYAFGDPSGAPLAETSRVAPAGRKGQVRAELARELLAAHARGELRVAIGRASHFVGPGVTQSMVGEATLARVARGRAAWVFGDPDAPHAFGWVDDVAEGLALLGTRPDGEGRAWNLPVLTCSVRALAEAVACAAGRARARVRALPDALLPVLGLFAPPLREMVELRYEWSAPYLVDDRAFREAFGARATSLEVAARALAASLTMTAPRSVPSAVTADRFESTLPGGGR